ncbi:hypothetical protein D5W64_12955 [Salmonella enterica subsp. enterica serovar Saintpaul]|nr:hypothetical protein [Salmonella enterica subsp. enterica serovar Saintpaul]
MAQTIIGQTPQKPLEETALPESYKNTIIESRYIPHTSLLSFVPGMPTRTIYYRGSYGRDEEQQGFEPESIQTYASYKRIHNLIIKIDNGNGNYNFDNVTGQGSNQLTGYVLFDLTPNKGDLFIKDIGDGRAGLYIVTQQPELRTIHADKCYYLEAELTAIMTNKIQLNLDQKVIEELYYSKSSAVNGGNAVLTKTDLDLNKKLYDLQFAIVDDILANHYYNDEDTIIIPNEDNDRLYDPYLAKFLSYVFPQKVIGARKKIRLLDPNYYVDSRRANDPMTVWDMFYRNDFSMPNRYKREYWTHRRQDIINTRMYGSVFFSKMDRMINVFEESARKGAYSFTGTLIPNITPGGYDGPREPGKPWTYFFTPEFYEGKGTETEQFVWKMFRDKVMDKKMVVDVLEKYWELDDITKLYMSGIYVGAIKQALITTSDYT